MRTRCRTTKRLLKLLAGLSAMAMCAAPSVFAANSEFLPAFSVETLTPASQAALAWKNVAPNALAGYYTYMPLTTVDATLAGFPAAAGCGIAPAGTSDCYIITAKKLLQPMSLEFLKFPAVMPDLVGLGSPNLFPGPGLIMADGATPFVDTSTLGSTLASAGKMTLAWGYGSGGTNWYPFGNAGPKLGRGNAPSVFQNTPIGLTTFNTNNTNPQTVTIPPSITGTPVTGIWHFPAPTIKGTSGRPVNVLWMHEVPNEKPLGLDPSVDCGTAALHCYPYNRIVLHVHGAHVGPESDGLATSWFSPVYALSNGRLNGEDNFLAGLNTWDSYTFKTVQHADGTANPIPAPYLGLPIYHYPMTQPAGTIWYHDHAVGNTHLNTEMGMAGFFPVTDAVEIALQTATAPALPVLPKTTTADTTNTFSTYEVGLALQDRHFDVNGKMAYPDIALYDKNDTNCVFDANNNALPGTCARLHWMKKINLASATDPQPAVHFVPYPTTPALVAAAPELNGTDAASTALNFPAGCQVNVTNTLENVAGVDPVTGARLPFIQCAPFPATSATLEYFGNMPVVNGVTYATYDVEPTVYRFRMIGGTDSRTWIAQLIKGNAQPSMVTCGDGAAPAGCAIYPAASIVPFFQVGTEQGLLTNMVQRNELDIMGGERIDVLADFTGLGGQTITMKNLGDDAPYSGRFDFDGFNAVTGDRLRQPTSVLIPEIMKFRVKSYVAPAVAPISAQTPVNGKLLTGVIYPTPPGYVAVPDMRSLAPTVTRTIALIEITDQYGRTMPTIDARGYVPPGIRTTEIMQQNVPERWDIVNTTVDAHPMHIHQVAFLPINRQAITLAPGAVAGNTADPSGFKSAFNNGLNYFAIEDHSDAFRQSKVFTPSQYIPDPASSPIPVAAYDAGLKDTIQIPPGYVSRNNIVFDVLGDYVWHCHILSHEEHDMMRPYRITNAAAMPVPASVAVGAVVNGTVTITIPPMAAPVPVATQYVVQFRKVGATFWDTNGQLTATQTVDLVPTGIGTYEFRAQIIEPALQSIHAMSRPDSAWVAGSNVAAYGTSLVLTPAGAIGNTPNPTFVWSDTGAGSTYDFLLKNGAGDVLAHTASVVATCNGSTCTYAPPALNLATGSYTWFVVSIGKTVWGAGQAFSVATPVVPGLVAKLTPTGAGATANPTFSWTQEVNSTSYVFYLVDTGTNTGLQYAPNAAATCTLGTCTYTPVSNLATPGTYSWYVMGVNAVGQSPWGTGMAFTRP